MKPNDIGGRCGKNGRLIELVEKVVGRVVETERGEMIVGRERSRATEGCIIRNETDGEEMKSQPEVNCDT